LKWPLDHFHKLKKVLLLNKKFNDQFNKFNKKLSYNMKIIK